MIDVLGFCKGKDGLNTLFDRGSVWQIVRPVCGYLVGRVIRKLSITLPCLLICGVAAGNEGAELFNGGGVNKQIGFNEVLDRWAVVIPVLLREINLSKRGSECGAEFCLGVTQSIDFRLAGSIAGVRDGKFGSEAIGKDAAQQSANNSKPSGNQSNFVGSKLHDLIVVFGGGFIGLAIGVVIVHIFFWLKHGISPIALWEKPN